MNNLLSFYSHGLCKSRPHTNPQAALIQSINQYLVILTLTWILVSSLAYPNLLGTKGYVVVVVVVSSMQEQKIDKVILKKLYIVVHGTK
jgi:hypothetical protein